MLLYYFKVCYIVILYSPNDISEILKSKKKRNIYIFFSKSLSLYFKGK